MNMWPDLSPEAKSIFDYWRDKSLKYFKRGELPEFFEQHLCDFSREYAMRFTDKILVAAVGSGHVDDDCEDVYVQRLPTKKRPTVIDPLTGEELDAVTLIPIKNFVDMTNQKILE